MTELNNGTGPGDLLAAIHHTEGQISALQTALVILNDQIAERVNHLEELHEALSKRLGHGIAARRRQRRKKGEQPA